VTAKSSTLDGIWNEQLKTDRGFVTAMKHSSPRASSAPRRSQIAVPTA
jgi:hypothetical protein